MRAVTLLIALLLLPPAWAAPRTVEEILPLQLASGTQVDLRLRRPEAVGSPRPALILLGGLQRGSRAIDLIPPELPLLVAGFDYPMQVPRKAGLGDLLRLAPEARRGVRDTRETLLRIYQHLQGRPDVDAERIILVGVSLGTPFALMAAAEAPIPVLILVHGFARIPDMIEHQFARRWSDYGVAGRGAAWLLSRLLYYGLRLPDVERDARRLRATQRVLAINAQDDRFVPDPARNLLWQSLQASSAAVETVMHGQGHIHPNDKEHLRALIALSLQWLQDERILDPSISATYQ